MSPQHSDNSDQLLQAHLYLAGELSPAEELLFEELLSQSSATCETLADLVLIEQMVQHSLVEPAPSRNLISKKSSTRRTLSFNIIGLSLSVLLFVIVAVFVSDSRPNTLRMVEQKNAPTIETETIAQNDKIATAALWTSMSRQPVLETDSIDDDAMEFEQTESSYDIPDWMFAAVEASNRKQLDDLDSDDDAFDLEETL